MKSIAFILFASVIGLVRGDTFLQMMVQQHKINLPDNYQIVSQHYTEGPANPSVHNLLALPGIYGTHEYTLMIDGKTCDLTVDATIEMYGFFMNTPHLKVHSIIDSCGLFI